MNKIDPAAISVDDLATLLSRAGGGTVTAEQIHADVAAGAPANGDGTMHLVRYAAWLVSQSP